MSECEVEGCARPKRSAHASTKYCEDCRIEVSRRHYREYASQHKAERAAYGRAYRAANPEAVRKKIASRYGLSLASWYALLASQGNVCAVCKTPDPGRKWWHTDHDHACCPGQLRSCGRCVRGILCTRCNMALGLLDDDPVRLRSAAAYLEGAA